MKKTIFIMSFLLFLSNARSEVHIIERHQDIMAIIIGHDAHILMALLENTDFYQDGEQSGHIICSLNHERCTISIFKNTKHVRRHKPYLSASIGIHRRLLYILEHRQKLAFDNNKIIFELKENECNVAILARSNNGFN